MKQKTIIIIILLAIAAIIGGIFIFHKEPELSLPDLPEPNVSDIEKTINGNNQFALDYYSRLSDKNDDNLFFSPFSISLASAMLYEGAAGETAEEIQSVFHFLGKDDSRRSVYQYFINKITGEKEDNYEINSANALWVHQDYQLSKSFSKVIEKYYQGKIANLDFGKNLKKSCKTINNWVEKQTKGKICDLISPNAINEETRSILINAIYFKGKWNNEFDESDTKKENFRTHDGKLVETEMMFRPSTFYYTENDDLQVLEIPYRGDEFSALFLLPKNDDLAKLESLLSLENISNWRDNLREENVRVFIPKFKFETNYFLADDLIKMGMPLAFTNEADFSKILSNNKLDLKIDEAIHKAFIEVDEKGTEAIAVTMYEMSELDEEDEEEPKVFMFRADHPFIFLIHQKNTGNIFFMGRVTNPNL